MDKAKLLKLHKQLIKQEVKAKTSFGEKKIENEVKLLKMYEQNWSYLAMDQKNKYGKLRRKYPKGKQT